jgi:hypothetical protein
LATWHCGYSTLMTLVGVLIVILLIVMIIYFIRRA